MKTIFLSWASKGTDLDEGERAIQREKIKQRVVRQLHAHYDVKITGDYDMGDHDYGMHLMHRDIRNADGILVLRDKNSKQKWHSSDNESDEESDEDADYGNSSSGRSGQEIEFGYASNQNKPSAAIEWDDKNRTQVHMGDLSFFDTKQREVFRLQYKP